MSDIRIDDDVPLPNRSGTNEYGDLAERLMRLERHGQSFFFPCEIEKCKALQKNVGVKMANFRKSGKLKFFTLTEVRKENDVQGVRVWRTDGAAEPA